MSALAVRPGGYYADGTLGGGGHARRLLELSGPHGRLLALDRDPNAIAHSREALAEFGQRVIFRQRNFAQLPQVLAELEWPALDGVLIDLGVSSHQLDTAERGFSFSAAGPLDMRMGPDAEHSAEELIATLREADLADLIYAYGEERLSRRIARYIKVAHAEGQLRTTEDLARVVARAAGKGGARQRIHPATRTFQALRIAVNRELDALDTFLAGVLALLRPGGRVAVIAFHSLEDRRVKTCFARWAGKLRDTAPLGPFGPAEATPPLGRLVARRAIQASPEEVADNSRARSARLRVIERLA